MTQEEMVTMLKAKLECMTRDTSGNCNSRECDECDLNYAQGNMGEQKEYLMMAIQALEQQSNIINASEVKQDDEWMQENKWDEMYKKDHLNIDEKFIQSQLESYKKLLKSGIIERATESQECDCVSRYPARPTCENAINRQAVKEQMIKYGFHAPDMTVTEFVENLPSVKPQERTGHWTRELIRNEKGGCIGAKMICSECGNDNKHDEYMNYCPNCGAKWKVRNKHEQKFITRLGI